MQPFDLVSGSNFWIFNWIRKVSQLMSKEKFLYFKKFVYVPGRSPEWRREHEEKLRRGCLFKAGEEHGIPHLRGLDQAKDILKSMGIRRWWMLTNERKEWRKIPTEVQILGGLVLKNYIQNIMGCLAIQKTEDHEF